MQNAGYKSCSGIVRNLSHICDIYCVQVLQQSSESPTTLMTRHLRISGNNSIMRRSCSLIAWLLREEVTDEKVHRSFVIWRFYRLLFHVVRCPLRHGAFSFRLISLATYSGLDINSFDLVEAIRDQLVEKTAQATFSP